MKIKGWNLFEIIWLIAFSAIALGLTIIWKDTVFGFSVFITGVLCVVLAAKGNIWTYVFGMYNTFGYAYIAFNNNLFGEMGLNLFFFAPMNIVGFIMWRKFLDGKIVKMRQMSNKYRIITGIICVISTFILGFLLSLIPKQNTPYIDATTNVLSVIATFLMTLRYKEQWLLYIVLNIFTIILWSYRVIVEAQDSLMMIVMWSAYLVNSVYGYYNWSKGVKNNEINSKSEVSELC